MNTFTNYLTAHRLQLLKHVRSVFTFTDTQTLSEAEVKAFVKRLTSESAIPIPSKTYEWLSQFFKYVKDKDQLLVYNNTTGLWHFEKDDSHLRNLLTDFFTTVAEEALKQGDAIFHRYAKHFFGAGKIPTLANRIKSSIAYTVERSDDIMKENENYRYFDTIDGRRALLDMTEPKFNLKAKTFQQTQPMHLLHKAPLPIAVTDDPPKLFLKLIDDYMLHDPVRIEYFHKVLAYLMSPYNYNQVLIYFIGAKGRNGKSTIIKVLQDILGTHSVRLNSALLDSKPSPSFKKDDALAATEGKSLFIFNEIDERMQASSQAIKDLTEGGRDEYGNKIWTVVRPAYSRNYEVNICGTPLVVANSLINFGDWTNIDPVFQRLILVPFDFHIKKEDPTLLGKLAKEYPKIQAWLYMNYFKHKGVLLKAEPRPTAVDRMFIQYRKDSDIIGLFLEECIDETGNNTDSILRSDLYRMYQLYCKVNGRHPIRNKGTNGFINLVGGWLDQHIVSQTNGQYYVRGVKHSVFYEKEVAPLAL